jgi:hypothetical protein
MAVRIVTADEFAAVVGLPGQITQIHASTIQVLLNASGKDGAGGRRAFLGEGPEEQTAANFPRRVFDQRQTQALGLGPELRNITQILGIGGDLLEQAPGRLHGSQILLALIFLSAFANQSVLAPDALDGHVRNGEIELSFQPGRSKGGQFATQSQDLLLDLGRGFVGAMLAKAEFDKPCDDKKTVRVAGPFTVESLSPHRVLGVDENDELIDELKKSGPDSREKQAFSQMILENLKTAGVQQAHI